MKFASKVSHTAATATAPPLPSSTSVSLVPNSTSGGYAWHSIPTAPPSEVDSEDVSLEARMNAEYNSIATGSLYTSPGTTDNNMTTRRLTPVSQSTRTGGERKGSSGKSEDTSSHVPDPDPPATETSSDGTITEPAPTVARSSASSTFVESLEEERVTGYMNKRNSTIVIGDQEKYIPSFADDRWVSDEDERERRNSVSYSRVPIPPPAPELRREYSNTRSLVSSANATYNSSSPRATVTVQFVPPTEEQRLQHVLAAPNSSPPSRPRCRSQTGPFVPTSRSELVTRPSDTRSSSHSMPLSLHQAEPRLDARRQIDSAFGLQFSATTLSSPDRATNVYVPSPNHRLEIPLSSRPELYMSSRNEHRASPPSILAGEMLRPQTTSPEPSPRCIPSITHYRSQSNSPPGKYRVSPPSLNDRTTVYNPHRIPDNVPYRPKSTAPPSSDNQSETTISFEPYRSQPTAPQETSYRSRSGRQPPGDTHTVTPVSSCDPQASISTATVSTSAYPVTQPSDPQVPLTRTRANSGSWSRNASFGSTTSPIPPPLINEAPNLSFRLANHEALHQGGQVDMPSAMLRDRGSPQSFITSVSINASPPQDARSSTSSRNAHSSKTQHWDGVGERSDASSERGIPQGKLVLTVRNPSPSETSNERSSNPSRAQQQSTGASLPQNLVKPHYPTASTTPSTTAHSHGRRSTLPYDSKTAGSNGQQVNDYGHRTTQLRSAHEPPKRRLSDGGQTDRPSFYFNPNEPSRNPALGRCVRWNENLICPSPVFPDRRKGWFNRHG